jgi:hypothetical protein
MLRHQPPVQSIVTLLRIASRPSLLSKHGVTWSPTIDPEHLKLLSQEIVRGAGVHLVFHAWAAAPIIEEDRVARDLFYRADAGCESDIDECDLHHCANIGPATLHQVLEAFPISGLEGLVGIGRVTPKDWSRVTPRPDEIGVSSSPSPEFPLLSVPYGCLVPRDIDGLLVAG